jgi:hypothetical protein
VHSYRISNGRTQFQYFEGDKEESHNVSFPLLLILWNVAPGLTTKPEMVNNSLTYLDSQRKMNAFFTLQTHISGNR